MTDQIITQPKLNKRCKAIISLIMGLVSTIPVIHLFFSASGGIGMAIAFIAPTELWLSILSIPGMILGIMELNSTRKRIAIGGVILSVIGFLSLIFFLYISWLAMIGVF